jgi:hypothetical protein
MPTKCGADQILRKAYTRKGKRVAAACIHRVSPYPEKYGNFQKATLKRMTARLRGVSKLARGNLETCPPGQILRKAYVRYSSTGKRRLMKAACITKRGASTRITGRPIGPLRKGELSPFGYTHIADLSLDKRHRALTAAVEKFGSLSVWKKINVLSIYFKNTNPKLSGLYNEDKNWIRTTFGLKAL